MYINYSIIVYHQLKIYTAYQNVYVTLDVSNSNVVQTFHIAS